MRRAGTIATTAVMAGVALLAWRAVRTEPASRAGASPAVEARLDQVIPEIDFRGIPFDQAIADLARRAGADVVLDEASLPGRGFDCATPVDLRLRNVTLRRALDAVTGYAGGGVCYTLAGEKVVVTHRDDLGKYAYVRVYDVRDITVEPRPPVDPNQHGIVCFPDNDTPLSPRQEADEELQWMMLDFDPEGWFDNGGSVGMIETASGRLIVLTTSETHRRIQSLLDQLRHPRARSE